MQYILIIFALFQRMVFGTRDVPGEQTSDSTNDGLKGYFRVLTTRISGFGNARLQPLRVQRSGCPKTRNQHNHDDRGFWPPDRL